MGLGSDSETRRDAVVQKRDAVLPTSTHNSPASHCSHHAASPTWCEVCERVVSSASRFFHKRCNESSVAQADGASTSAVRPVIRNAVQSLVPLSPHWPSPGNCLREHRESRRLPHHASQRPAITPVEVDLRASAVLSSSECLFSGGDDALATHFLALTHHAWPNHYSGATQPNPQRPNPQRQRSRSTFAEARTRQQHGHSETQSCSSSNSGSSAKTSPPWLMFHRLPSVLN